jgi:hypothetical protein
MRIKRRKMKKGSKQIPSLCSPLSFLPPDQTIDPTASTSKLSSMGYLCFPIS